MRFKGSKESAVMDFSLIIPCFNEAENVGPFLGLLVVALKKLNIRVNLYL